MNLIDYLYVDLEKVISLYSQLTGGVIELRETNRETTSAQERNKKFDFRVFQYDSGESSGKGISHREVIKPHHAVLQELEERLDQEGHIIDLSQFSSNPAILKDSEIRDNIGKSLCIKCKGRIVIEDYKRLQAIANDYPEIVKFINKSIEENLKQTKEYQEALSSINQIDTSSKDRNQKAKKEYSQKALKKKIEKEVKEAAQIDEVDEWILDGLKTWIDAFLPGIVNVRLYPNTDQNDEHIFGHLNDEGFMISDKTAFHFTYGSFPTEEFTLLGIVTSVPKELSEDFDPLAEFKKGTLTDHESVENGFRGVFRGFDGMEEIIRTIRYPRVLVHPLLLYREATPNNALQG